ncbi:MAG: hypothetical protein LQ352_000458 [Teloschistes flavicans]|nr:MAG: hypothetical protein LQ352_000458 [Teloschistes flavicans]
MSGQATHSGGHQGTRPTTNGSNSGALPVPQQRASDGSINVGNGGQVTGVMSQPHLNGIVLEYLSKKGYNRTEAMLRMESANQDVDGRPIHTRVEESGGLKYAKAFDLFKNWVEGNLEIYKPDLRRLLWPVFVYSFLDLVSDFYPREAKSFFSNFRDSFANEHQSDLRTFQAVALPEHVTTNELSRIYHSQRYRVTLSQTAFYNLIQFLESKETEGGAVVIGIIQTRLNVVTVDRTGDDQFSLVRLLERARHIEEFPAEDEGIPGHNPGSANIDRNAGTTVLTKLKLGQVTLDSEARQDVLADLEEEDKWNPPAAGQPSLVDTFEQRIKREESEEVPGRTELPPRPPPLARDVAMEVQKVKENRDRFQISGRTGGVGPGVSVTMFTFHNTNDSITCLDFSKDYLLIAAGTDMHYIRVWSIDGSPLPVPPQLDGQESRPSASHRLIGHSGPVYAVSFAPATASSVHQNLTKCKHLLSSSADRSVRLWSLDAWACLVVYRGHDGPVWDVTWAPHGHYFLTGSYDRTARLWSTDRVDYLRLFVGHDRDVDHVCFHPNDTYIFTGSSDKMVRMWLTSNGYPVRMFTGHAGSITALTCSPDGKILASADDSGTIILWDLTAGKLLKRMRGHGKGGIWSLTWSVESTVVVSGGADGTVRVWDVQLANDAGGQGKVIGEGGAGQKIDGTTQVSNVSGAGGKKKTKEVVVTSDQISAFPTKKSSVYKVMFTQQNLVLAGGAYLP